MKYRTENDLLGERQVPEDAYYGIHTLRAIENFKISKHTINDLPILIRAMTMVKKSVAQANKELGALHPDIADHIIKASYLILNEGKCMDQFPIDCFQGAGTSINMNMNEVIANLALEIMGESKGSYHIIDPHDHVNKSQSTNDVYSTSLRIAIYTYLQELIVSINYLKEGLDEKAEEFQSILKLGRTQLQDALPIMLGQEFKAFSSLLKDQTKHLERVSKQLLNLNLGGTEIGTGLNTPDHFSKTAVRYLSEITSLDFKITEDFIAATSDCSDYVSIHSELKKTAIRLSKICNDLRLLSSGPRAGFAEINLPELQAGSSIIPAKVNPILPEVVNQACFKVIGNDTTVAFASEAGQLQLNAMLSIIAQCIFESIVLLKNSTLTLRDKCIDGITANEANCLDNVLNSVSIIACLNPIIGHKQGDAIGRECIQTGKTVKTVVLEKGLLTEAQLDEIFSLENLKKSTGILRKI